MSIELIIFFILGILGSGFVNLSFQNIGKNSNKSTVWWNKHPSIRPLVCFMFLPVYLIVLNTVHIGLGNTLGIAATIWVFIALQILFFLSIDDTTNYDVQSWPLYALIVMGLLPVIYFQFFDQSEPLLTSSYTIIPLNHIVTAFVYAGMYLGIYVVSKGAGMGEADMYIAFFTGLVLGPIYTLISFYAMVFSTIVVSLPEMRKRKSFRGIKLPLIPFMFAGIIISLIVTPDIIQLFLSDSATSLPF